MPKEKPKDVKQSIPPSTTPIKDNRKKPSDWNLESPYDAPATIEDLVNLAPFKDASDSKGGSFTAASRVPTWLERKIIWFTEMKGTPYQLKSDVVRDAIYLGIRVLHARYKGNPDWATEAKMTEAVGQVGVLARVKEQVTSLSKGLEELWTEGDEKQAIEGLERFVGAAVEMQDGWQKSKVFQYIRGNRVLKQISEECNAEVKQAVFGNREHKK